MTTLIQAMLEAAKVVSDVYEGTATGGSTTTLIDTAMRLPSEYFTGGTLWFGSNCVVIDTHNEHTFRFATVTSGAAAGTAYSASTDMFGKAYLKSAVLHVLTNHDILQVNSAMTAAQEVTLASGVYNVKRVVIDDVTSYQWREMGGKLIFDSDPTGATSLDVWYEAPHATIAESGTINTAIDLNWLKWAAAEHLWRQYIQATHKDNPVATDMLNEAKQEAEKCRIQARRFGQRLVRDPKHASWA